MTYLKLIQYLYLVFAAVFIYDGIAKIQKGESYALSFIVAAVAIAMFFFRRHFYKKYQK